MNPFDIYFAVKPPEPVVKLTPAEQAAKRAEKRRLERKRLAEERVVQGFAAPVRVGPKRGANPQYKKKKDDVVAPVPEGQVATPRTRTWKTGEYKPGAMMRDAVNRAKAEQPALMSIFSKEKT